MKAAVMHEFGGPEVLKYEEIPTPELGLNDVLVKDKAWFGPEYDLFSKNCVHFVQYL